MQLYKLQLKNIKFYLQIVWISLTLQKFSLQYFSLMKHLCKCLFSFNWKKSKGFCFQERGLKGTRTFKACSAGSSHRGSPHPEWRERRASLAGWNRAGHLPKLRRRWVSSAASVQCLMCFGHPSARWVLRQLLLCFVLFWMTKFFLGALYFQELNGQEPEQTPGDSELQGNLACCTPWDHNVLDAIEWLNNNTFQKVGKIIHL